MDLGNSGKIIEKIKKLFSAIDEDRRPPFELVSPEEAATRERRQNEIREMIAGIGAPK